MRPFVYASDKYDSEIKHFHHDWQVILPRWTNKVLRAPQRSVLLCIQRLSGEISQDKCKMSLYSFHPRLETVHANTCRRRLTFTLRRSRHLINYVCWPALTFHLFQRHWISANCSNSAGCCRRSALTLAARCGVKLARWPLMMSRSVQQGQICSNIHPPHDICSRTDVKITKTGSLSRHG